MREEKRKRKVVCWPCHQTLAFFTCGMWNFLSLAPYASSRGFSLSAGGHAGHTYCKVGRLNSECMTKYSCQTGPFPTFAFPKNASLWSRTYWWGGVEFTTVHSWAEKLIVPMRALYKIRETKETPLCSGVSIKLHLYGTELFFPDMLSWINLTGMYQNQNK